MRPLVEAEGEPLLGQFNSIHVPQRRYDDVTKTTKEKGIPENNARSTNLLFQDIISVLFLIPTTINTVSANPILHLRSSTSSEPSE